MKMIKKQNFLSIKNKVNFSIKSITFFVCFLALLINEENFNIFPGKHHHPRHHLKHSPALFFFLIFLNKK
jgi:hypothetical protein